jgi:DNA modification methylase
MAIEPYYQDDAITLFWGDCRELLPRLAFDAIVTDPPYGIGANKMQLGDRPKWRRLERGAQDWDASAPDLAPLLAADVPTIIWGGNHFPLPPSRAWLVWDKKNGNTSYADCELAWTNLDMPVRKFVKHWGGDKARETHERRYHPTQKSLEVMHWCLGFLEPGVVFDPYAGSGTTLLAARNIGRKAVGVEIEERYCEMAAYRCQQTTLAVGVEPEHGYAGRFDLAGDG